MNNSLDAPLDSLLHAHIGREALRTPRLNRLQVLVDTVTASTASLQALAKGAPQASTTGARAAEPLRTACDRYWADLAPGTVLSRFDHARALYAEDLQHRAQLLAAFGEISEAGQQTVQKLIDPAPRDDVEIYAVALHTCHDSRVILPGAVLAQVAGGERSLLVFPGLAQQLFEFDNRTAAAHALIEYLRGDSDAEMCSFLESQGGQTGQAPALASPGVEVRFATLGEHFLDYSLKASIAGASQRVEKVWCSLPASMVAVVKAAVTADGRRQAQRLIFGSSKADVAHALFERQLSACENGIQRYIGRDLQSAEYKCYRQVHAAWQAAHRQTAQLIDGLHDQGAQRVADAWTERDAHGLNRRQALAAQLATALRHDAQLQVYEGTLQAADLALVVDVVSHPVARQRSSTGTVVAEVVVGESSFSYRLPGVYIIAAPQAWADSGKRLPVLLFKAGEDGGVRRFDSLQQLYESLAASFADTAFTSLWAHCPTATDALRRLAPADLPLVARAVPDNWIDAHLGRLIHSHEQRWAAAITHSERELLAAELASALRQPLYPVRDQAVDRIAEQRRQAALLQALPTWLSTSPPAQRTEYAALLDHYNALARGQAQWLRHDPLRIQDFARSVIQNSLKADLKACMDVEHIRVKLPVSVEVKTAQNALSEMKVPSKASSTLSIVELALLEIDPQLTLRLGFARLVQGERQLEVSIPGLDIAYLCRRVIGLDVARQYREKVQTLLGLDPGPQASDSVRNQVLALPYCAAFRLQAFTAYRQGQISKCAWHQLDAVTAARTADQLGRLGVTINRVALSLGADAKALPSGLLLIHLAAGNTYLLYLPGVPEGAVLLQGSTPQALAENLLRRLRNAPMRQWLAGLAGVGHTSKAREHYLHRAHVRSYSGFLTFTPVTYPVWPMGAALLKSRRLKLLADASLASRDVEALRRTVAQQLRDGAEQLPMSGLYYLPGLDTGLALQDGWPDPAAAVSMLQRGDRSEGLPQRASPQVDCA